MFKADLHLHSKDDYEHPKLKYSTYELIDFMAKQGYKVLAITFHNQLYYTKELINYAKKKRILLIPGVELRVQNRHILVYNAKPEELKNIHNFQDLKKLKRKNTLIIAAHPFFGKVGAGHFLEKFPEAFDGVEYCHYYLSWLNKNKKAVKVAQKNNFVILGNSDAHHFSQIGHTYTNINAKKQNIESILKAIKNKHTELVTKPLPFHIFLKVTIWVISTIPLGFLNKTKVEKFYNRSDL